MNCKSTKIERVRKPKKCPACGYSPLASILYGMPNFSADLEQMINEGNITFGGCCVTGDDPTWKCKRCGIAIFRKKTP